MFLEISQENNKMEQIVVKTEVQNNGEILLYYVDENGESQQGIVTSLENVEQADIEHSAIQIQNNYMLSNLEDYIDESSLQTEVDEGEPTEWSSEEMKRLLIFYVDNKQSFLISGVAQRQHLWTVACKTMLIGKDWEGCETQLNDLQSKYNEVLAYTERGVYVKWDFLHLCQQAFGDIKPNDPPKLKGAKQEEQSTKKIAVLKQEVIQQPSKVVKQINTRNADEKVEQMLRSYLKYKHKFQHDHWRKDLWETITQELGKGDDTNYWHKRFLNYKQHYINLLLKQQEDSSITINWPYKDLFDQIYHDDVEFINKYFNTADAAPVTKEPVENEDDWNTSHITILGKHFYDCYEEFEDPTIPNMFLWTEVGRIIGKKPQTCKEKYTSLREQHIKSYVEGSYSLQNRNAIAIILDNIIAKDVKREFFKAEDSVAVFKSVQIDSLVKFFSEENLEAFKDPICHFVCWEAVSTKIKHNVRSCRKQWDELVSLYKSILEEKKNDPELQIDWRYIDKFDTVFDYGMDMNFMVGYYVENMQNDGKISVKKVTIKEEDVESFKKTSIDEKSSNSPRTDPRSTKILEFYLKNKDKFKLYKNKLEIWDPLAKEIDMNTTQCAHRFRHLKQTFLDTVQKEIMHPKSLITWPYYTLCKKVFGYRAIKNKLKSGAALAESDWLAREIKQLITFFSKNFNDISNNIHDISKWQPLAVELKRSPLNCRDKFVELRKCYRKLKTMKSRNPDVKISWSHFPMFDRIYTSNAHEDEPMEVETLEEEHLDMDDEEMAENGDEDYQCIIVLQEGQEISDIANAQIVIQDPSIPQSMQETESVLEKAPELPSKAWTKRTKKLLLIHYINYMRSHRGRKIVQKQLWDDIAAKIPNKTNRQCKKMFNKLKNAYAIADEDKKKTNPLHSLMEKVLKLKPNFSITPMKDAKIQKTFLDVHMDPIKVDSALVYYLNHIDDFVDPKFEKTYLWTELANHISEPVNTVYNKINYLKQAYNVVTGEIDGQKSQWSDVLNEIIVKEVSTNALLDQTKPSLDDNENWSNELTESLLTWYLGNLDKFKNPKFNRSYLWIEASAILKKSPVVCSKKMSQIRSDYRNMVKNNATELNNWQFLDLCQKIYGTGRKSSVTDFEPEIAKNLV